MSMSLKRLDQALKALKSPRRNKHDIQTWLSASLTFQQTCKDYAEADNPKLLGGFLGRISKKMDYLSALTSNPLALVNRITGMPNGTKPRRQLLGGEEKQKFPKWVSGRERKLLQESTIKANVIVAQDGSGNYKTVSEAIQAASGSRFVIYVKAGVYKEKIHSNKDGISLIGDGKYSTIIVGGASVNGGTSLSGSATFS
ncbi:hypothetical protein L6164_011866 [Bauhinia variegata]|uniref:Uncharacterized protein n=1 Tax=Bauhinia variegata TaxID=167791 RepID=A0ACB9P7B2_BAUVA|nr:hypothetical protein L6164_011866 [Bauhinia variegata]